MLLSRKKMLSAGGENKKHVCVTGLHNTWHVMLLSRLNSVFTAMCRVSPTFLLISVQTLLWGKYNVTATSFSLKSWLQFNPPKGRDSPTLSVSQTGRLMEVECQRPDGRTHVHVFTSPSLLSPSADSAWTSCSKSAPRKRRPKRAVWRAETGPEIWKGNVNRKLPTDQFQALHLKLGSLLGSFTYNYEGASGEGFSSTKCSETFWEKSLRSVVLNLSLIFPQWTSVLKDFVCQIAC